MHQALSKDSYLAKQRKHLSWYPQRNSVTRFPVFRRKINSECIGFSANGHCSWVVLPKPRKAIMFDIQGMSDGGSPVSKNGNFENRGVELKKEKHQTLRQVPTIKNCKNQNSSPCKRQKYDKCWQEIRLRKETKKRKERQWRHLRVSDVQYPVPVSSGLVSKTKLDIITVEYQSKGKHSDISFEKDDGDGCGVALKPNELGLSVVKSFPMAKIDRFFFFLVLSAWVIVGVRNLIEGFSDVSRPCGRGF